MKAPFPDSWRRWWPALWLLAAVLALAGRYGNSLQVDQFGRSLWGWLLQAPSHTDTSFRILLPFTFALMLWHQRNRILANPSGVAWRWFPLYLGSLALVALAYRLQSPRVGCVAMLLLAWSGMAVLRGGGAARACLLPVLYLLLALPDLFHGLAMSMRLVSAEAVAWLLSVLHYPWELHGTLFLRVVEPLSKVGVDDVCSGISSLAALAGIMIPYAILSAERISVRCFLLALLLPVALLVNILRVASVMLLVEWYGDSVAMAYHDTFIAGALPYGLGVFLLMGLEKAFARILPPPGNIPDGEPASDPGDPGRPLVAMALAATSLLMFFQMFSPARVEPVHALQLPDQAGPWAREPHRWCTNTACGKVWMTRDVTDRCPSCRGTLHDWAAGEQRRMAYLDAYATAYYVKPGEADVYVHALVAKPEDLYKGWPPRLLLDMYGSPDRFSRLVVPGAGGHQISATLVEVRFPSYDDPSETDGYADSYAAYWFAADDWAESSPWSRDLRIWVTGLREGRLPRPITYLVLTRRSRAGQDEGAGGDRVAHFVTEFSRALELQRLDAVDRGR